LADFGLSIQLPCDPAHRNVKKPIRGSPVYLAPELLSNDNKYTSNVDIWSLGITFTDYLLRRSDNDYSITCTEECVDQNDILERIKSLLINNHYIDLTMFSLPNYIENLLHKMLQFDKLRRPNITDLYKGKVCKKVEMIDRGAPKTDIGFAVYYQNIQYIIDLCFALSLKLTTCYFTIDLIERYVHNYEIKTSNSLYCYSIAMLILATSFYENEMLDLDAIAKEFENYFRKTELILSINLMLYNFKYRLSNCDTDQIFYLLYNKYDYDKFENVYRSLYMKKVYSSDLFIEELVDVYKQYFK
jgi:serine/threonine protein kinase